MTQDLAAITNRSARDAAATTKPLRSLWLMLTVLAADQATKTIAVEQLQDGAIAAPGPFSFELVANSGALLGIPVPTWLLGTIALVVSTSAVLALKAAHCSRQIVVGYGLLIGGAFGNLIDRVQDRPNFPRHAVVDWIATSTIPTFNLADLAIFVGITILLFPTRKSHASQKSNHNRSSHTAVRG